MIYELETYDLKPRCVARFEQRCADLIDKRAQLSPLAASWHTEIGPLNQVVQIWPYRDMRERDSILAAAAREGAWPPKIDDLIVTMRSDIMVPFAFSPPLAPAQAGPFFEMRTYTYAAGELPKIIKLWEKTLPARLEYGPVTGLMHSSVGALNKFVNIWPYKSLDERVRVRAAAHAAGVWPPTELAEKRGEPSYELLTLENKILISAAFSPLR